MFEMLLWLIIVGAIIASKAKKTQSNSQPQKKDSGTYYQRPQPQNKNFAVMPEQKRVQPNVERKCMVEDNHRSENHVYHQKASTQTSVPNVKRDYTQAPKQTREQKASVRMAAKRLYEGDRVPNGYRMVKCGYCAAENLIAYSSRGQYMCYFCHEDL